MHLFDQHRCSLLDGRRRVKATRQLLFESVDGRGQETIRHFGRRLDAGLDRLGQIPFEIGKEKPGQGFGNKGHGTRCCWTFWFVTNGGPWEWWWWSKNCFPTMILYEKRKTKWAISGSN